MVQLASALAFSDVNDAEAAVMFTHRAVHLGLWWSGAPIPEPLQALAAYTVVGDLLVVGLWCAAPLAFAAVVFCRRELVSGVG